MYINIIDCVVLWDFLSSVSYHWDFLSYESNSWDLLSSESNSWDLLSSESNSCDFYPLNEIAGILSSESM